MGLIVDDEGFTGRGRWAFVEGMDGALDDTGLLGSSWDVGFTRFRVSGSVVPLIAGLVFEDSRRPRAAKYSKAAAGSRMRGCFPDTTSS